MSLESPVGNETATDQCHRLLADLERGSATDPRSKVFIVLVMSVLVIFIFLLNLVLLLSLTLARSRPSHPTVSVTLTISLVTADLLLSLSAMPLSVYVTTGNGWALGHAACRLFTAADIFLCTVSIMHLAGLAADRYVAILHPFVHLTLSTCRARGFCAVLWMLALLICLPVLVPPWHVRTEPTARCLQDLYQSGRTCVLPLSAVYQSLALVFGILLPLLLIVGLHGPIYYVSRAQAKRIQAASVPPPAAPASARTGVSSALLGARAASCQNGDEEDVTGNNGREDVTGNNRREDNVTGNTRREDVTGNNRREEDNVTGNTRRQDNVTGNTMRQGNGTGNKVREDNVTGNKVREDNDSGNNGREDNVTGNKVREENVSGNNGREDNVTGNTRRHDNVTGNKVREDNVTGNKVREDNVTGNNGREDNVTGNKVREDNVTGNNGREDNVTGNKVREDNVTGNNGREDNVTGNNGREDNVTGNNRREDNVTVQRAERSTERSNSHGRHVREETNSRKTVVNGRAEHKAVRTVLCLVLCFVLCWSPLLTTLLVQTLSGYRRPPTVVVTAFTWLSYTNSLLNPLLLYRFNPVVRHAMRRLLTLHDGHVAP